RRSRWTQPAYHSLWIYISNGVIPSNGGTGNLRFRWHFIRHPGIHETTYDPYSTRRRSACCHPLLLYGRGVFPRLSQPDHEGKGREGPVHEDIGRISLRIAGRTVYQTAILSPGRTLSHHRYPASH